jgi:hypothetical protein
MNERIEKFITEAIKAIPDHVDFDLPKEFTEKFADLIVQDMHRNIIASILITDVVMEEKGQVPTSEDYIRAINKDFGVTE